MVNTVEIERKGFLDTAIDPTLDLFEEIEKLKKEFPSIPIKTVDERYSSKMAKEAMIDMGMKKKERRNKALVDEIAATILLQEYLNSKASY